jgi:hypothetical protein
VLNSDMARLFPLGPDVKARNASGPSGNLERG